MDSRTRALLVVTLDVDPAVDEAAFNKWYFEDHIPSRLKCPGFLAASRFYLEPAEGAPATETSSVLTSKYLAIWELEGPEALETPEYLELRRDSSAETQRMRDAMQNLRRYVYVRMEPPSQSAG